jgi:signal transduction histidine kinase
VCTVPRSQSDGLLAAVFVLVIQAELWWYDGGPAGVPVVTAVSSAVFAGLLALRSSRTELMAGLAAFVVATQAMLGGRMTGTLSLALASMLMTFTIGLRLPRPRALRWAAPFLLATWFDLVAIEHDEGVISDLVFVTVLVVGAPLLAGAALREHRLRAEELERLNTELRAEREETARLAALDERARIARDVHDVVAHSVSLMVVQAGAARHMLDRDPEQSRVALASVESVGREALHELRSTLGVLRGAEPGTPELAQAGLAQLEALVESMRGGLDITLERATVEGTHPGALTTGTDVAAFRIVQEALTNALKHAPGSRVLVRVDELADGVRLVVEDDGPGPSGSSPGHGLQGMRERAQIHGGTVDAGPRPQGGFRVEAHLPHDAGRVTR